MMDNTDFDEWYDRVYEDLVIDRSIDDIVKTTWESSRKSQWVDVKERLPEYKHVMVNVKFQDGSYGCEKVGHLQYNHKIVTHWQYIRFPGNK